MYAYTRVFSFPAIFASVFARVLSSSLARELSFSVCVSTLSRVKRSHVYDYDRKVRSRGYCELCESSK